MEIIKRKILLEDYINRQEGPNYGQMTATTFYINVQLNSDMKDMGMFTNLEFINKDPFFVNYSGMYRPLWERLETLGIASNFNFYNNPTANFDVTGDTLCIRDRNKVLGDFLFRGITVTGFTSNRLDVVSSYGFMGNDRFIPGFDVILEEYVNYTGGTVLGGTRVVSNQNLKPIIYTEDADINNLATIGTLNQIDGIVLTTNTGNTRTIEGTIISPYTIDTTSFSFQGQSLNNTNVVLSALTKEEYLLHITQPPKVDSNIFIDRGSTTVLQSHLQLGEINSMAQLVEYGNGFYNIVR